MPVYTTTPASGNMIDEMMEALRPYVSPQVLKETEPVKPARTLKDVSTEIDQLVTRMTAGLDAIAEAAGADRCPYCGEWTMEIIELEDVDEFGRYQEGYFCSRCVPGRS